MTFFSSCNLHNDLPLWKKRFLIFLWFYFFFIVISRFILSMFYVLIFLRYSLYCKKNFYCKKTLQNFKKNEIFKFKNIPCFFTWASKSKKPIFPCYFSHAKNVKRSKKNTFWSTSYLETLLTNIFQNIPRF